MINEKMYNTDDGMLKVWLGKNSEGKNQFLGIRNMYGDGTFESYLIDSMEEFESYKKEHYIYEDMADKDYHYFGKYVFVKNAVVLCESTVENHADKVNLSDYELFTLKGLYSIFVNYGKVYFVKD